MVVEYSWHRIESEMKIESRKLESLVGSETVFIRLRELANVV